MKPILLVDFGSTFTKVTGVDIDQGILLGTARSFTTIENDITIGLNNAVKILEDQIGPKNWSEKLGCSSAAGGLKMVAIGLVPELTSKAAKNAALSAGAKILKTYSYKLNQDEVKAIEDSEPDIVLLSGGTDGGNEKVVLHNARLLVETQGPYPVIYAGNKSVLSEVRNLFELSSKDLIVAGNVMPTLNQLATDEVKKVIADLFIHRIIEAKGLSKAETYLDQLLMPTPTAVMIASNLLATGTERTKGLGDLMVLDMGGATTDIHSACDGYPGDGNIVLKGLKEAYIKRTVEGDLGARYSLRALVESIGMDRMAGQLGWTSNQLEDLVTEVERNPDTIAESGSTLEDLDTLSSLVAVIESSKRHSGSITSHYTPFGEMYEQVGKDLTSIKSVIGTGGPIIHHSDPRQLLSHVCYDPKEPMSLRPKKPNYYIDQHYIMAAMGILATEYPEEALKIMLKEIVQVA